MKSIIVLILFMSFTLFAQEPMSQSQTEGHEVQPETQASPSTSEEAENPFPFFTFILADIQKGGWKENRAPGPVFNTCFTWEGAVQCYWAVFRMDNLTGQYRKEAYAIYNHLTAEGLQTELHYLKASPDSLNPYSKVWFLLMAVEFVFWAAKEGLTDVHKITPMARTITSELFHFVGSYLNDPLKGMNRAGFVLILYALYSYASLDNTLTEAQFDQALQTLESSIKNYFLHRNDDSQADQEAKTQTCSHMKRAGIHKDYLKEKGLLLHGYEEFEEQTTQEDINRIKDCEKDYETITFSGGGPGEPKDMISSFYYASILLLLKRTGGNEAVRYFIRHNPVFYKEFSVPEELFDDTRPVHNTLMMLSRHMANSILKDLYDDPEWQMDWESIENDLDRAFLAKNLLNFESSLFHLFVSSELLLLDRKIVVKE